MAAVLFGLLVIAGMAGAAAVEAPLPPHTVFTIDSTVLQEVRRINVYTPPDYQAAMAASYPVLYMLDGGLDEDFPHVARDVDAAIRAGQMRPMIVVGIENTERRRDMTGPTTVASDRAIAPHVGGSFAFRAFIADELMPQVRERYRTNGKTALVGESLAGLFVVETFLLQPRLFESYVALSPSLWWNNMALTRAADARLKAWPGLSRTLYFATASDDDIGEASELLQTALRTNAPPGLRWFYDPWPELHHDNIYIKASPAVFRQLFPPE